MVVLLIGGSSRMMDAMIDKLNKGDNRIYLLTGRRDKNTIYKRVFERYDFTYVDESIKDIFESIRPDLVIYMGAYDTNFDWSKARQESARYISSLMNILAAFSLLKKGRFVYISSQEVYGSSNPNNILEVQPASPKGFKSMAIVQGEGVCENYQKSQGIDLMILRLDNVYGIPKKGQEESNPCFRMCLQALKTGRISANEKVSFSMLYLNDAVELSFKALMEPNPGQICYHISSMDEINEMQLAKMIREKMGVGIEVINNSMGESRRIILDGNKYKEEYTQKIFTEYEKGVEQTAQYMKRHASSFLSEEDAGGGLFGKLSHRARVIIARLIPFIENIVCFFIFYNLNNLASGSRYFQRLDFYLLYVLLFAIAHGQQQAIVSALFAMAGYLFGQMQERTGFEIMLDYNTYVWIAELFIVGMVVGYIKDQLRYVKDEDEKEIRYLYGKMEDIANINDSNVRMKHNFEEQLVNQKDSLGRIYEITSSLEGYGPEEVLFYAAKVLSELMDSKDVAIYTVANRNYARLFSSTSKEARKLGNSIEYTAMEEMYAKLSERRVYVNKTMKDNYPLMASAVYAEDGMQMILMLWGIPWERMTLAEANRLTVVGYLIQNAVVRANRYLEALRNQRYLEGTRILSKNAFSQLVNAFFEAKHKGLTECALLEILAEQYDIDRAAKILGSGMRQTDYMGVLGDNKLYILLPNTDEENATGVMERFLRSGFKSRLRRGATT